MSDAAAARAAAVRRGVGLFPADDRGLLEVRGADRVRWLDAILSNDVATLAPGPERSGVHALLLSPQARILADLRVLHRGECFWLELARDAVADAKARLERYIVADDVVLADRSDAVARFGLEGPRAGALLADACGAAPALAPFAIVDVAIAGVPVAVAAFGWSGEPACQLFVPAPQRAVVADALRRAGGAALVEGDGATLEVLRVEAGMPRVGAEIRDDVLPMEVGLVPGAVKVGRGCYPGQAIVSRMASRERAGHRLVGLRFEGALPAPGAALERAGGRRVGEVTSVAMSDLAGAIGLGFVRPPDDAPDTHLRCAGVAVRVVALPHVTGAAERGRTPVSAAPLP